MAETDLFKWRHYESEIILLCVRWYPRYALSYRDLEEMMRERGLSIAKSPNLQKTLDFPAGSQYSRLDDQWFNCLQLGLLLRLQSAS